MWLTKIHDTSKDVLEILEEDHDIARGKGLRYLIRACSRNNKPPLLLGQPACLLGEIRHEEKCRDADRNRQDAFKDEDPPPITQA